VLLLVERRAGRRFEPAEVDFARRLGTTVGLALENARLFEAQIEARRLASAELRNSDLLVKSAKLLASGLSPEAALNTLAEVVVEALPHSRVTVQRWDATSRTLTIAASRGNRPAPEGTEIAFSETSAAFREMLARKVTKVTDFDAHSASAHGRIGEFASRLHCGVPLVAGGELVGVLVVDDPGERRPFPEREIALLEAIAAQATTAIENARVFEAQRRIAATLQENFIHALPEVAGLELGVVSKTAFAAELVGGDFSDVFVVDDDHVVALIGDVAGKGVRAAGMTETVRSTVRALAAIDPSPAFVLGKANELLLRFDPDEPHVTAFLAVLDPHTGHLSYASAGHPAPVHLSAFTCRPLDVTFGPPLGSFERPYTNANAMLTLDSYLVLYTDGVTEARQGAELLGEKRLIEVVCALRGLSAQQVAEGVREAALAFAGKLSDDLQVVVLRLA
jgi:GAF domain-containing protein